MSKWVASAVLDGSLNIIKNNATSMVLLSTYAFGDSYSTVAANTVAAVTMTSSNYTLSGTTNNPRVLTTASGLSATATASTNQYDAGTANASGSSTTTLADPSKSWTTNQHAGRALTITAGTGSGQTARITSNTATILTFVAADTGTFTVAPDSTSVYKISDDLHIAFTDGSSTVYYVTDESSNQAILAGNTINFPSLQYSSGQPI